MAVEFFTGFEGCTSLDQAQSLFDIVGSRLEWRATGGWDDGSWVITHRGDSGYYIKNLQTPLAQVVFGAHTGVATGDSVYESNQYFLRFRNGSSNHISLVTGDVGEVTVRNSAGDILDTLSVPGFGTEGDLVHFEVMVIIDETNGYVGVKLNGVLISELEDINTKNPSADPTVTNMYLGSCQDHIFSHNDPGLGWDNVFIADDWAGELKSRLIIPSADDSVAFDPSAGSDNYALVETDDGDTSYVSSDIVDTQDMYEFGPTITELMEIPAVSIVVVARKDDVGARQLTTLMEQDAVEYELETGALGGSYPSAAGQGFIQTLALAPDGSAWSPTIVNALKAGFKVA